MNIQQAVQTCFAKYVDFSGRGARSEYWWFVLAYVVLAVVAGFIHTFAYYIVVLAFLLPLLSAGARRLHDVGRSGWWLLLGLIPLVGLVLLYFMVQPSQPESNAYGAPPAQAQAA